MGPFAGRDALVAAYRGRPPDDEVRVLSAEERPGGVEARYSWAAGPDRRAGRLLLTLHDSLIERLVVTFEDALDSPVGGDRHAAWVMKVETGELLSIGRFARLSGLTVKALRHYDAEGLLGRPRGRVDRLPVLHRRAGGGSGRDPPATRAGAAAGRDRRRARCRPGDGAGAADRPPCPAPGARRRGAAAHRDARPPHRRKGASGATDDNRASARRGARAAAGRDRRTGSGRRHVHLRARRRSGAWQRG